MFLAIFGIIVAFSYADATFTTEHKQILRDKDAFNKSIR